MKPRLLPLFLLACLNLQAQNNLSAPTLKLATGYALEYPGLGGYSIGLEYDVPVLNALKFGLGTRILQLSGYPRTSQINEYTKAETIDFDFYWLPLESEAHSITLGLTYSFCFYNIKRAFPIADEDIAKPLDWAGQESSGRTSGFSISGEYAYHFRHSPLCAGLRIGIYKGYAYSYFVGPVIGFQF